MRGVASVLLVLLFLTCGSAARAQDRTPLRVELSQPSGRVRAEEGLEGAVALLQSEWRVIAQRVSGELGIEDPEPVEIVLLHGDTFQGWARGLLPDWGVAYANWPDGPIAIDMERVTRGPKPFAQILAHELSHVYLGQKLRGQRPPTWFVEGVAQQQSGEWTFSDTMSLIQAASWGGLPRLSHLAGRFPAGGKPAEMAYRVSLQAVREVDRRLEGRGGWMAVVDAVERGERFDQAFARLLGVRIDQFEVQLEDRLQGRYGWMAAFASAGSLFTGMTLLFLIGGLRARWRARRRLQEMGREEALLDDPEN